MPVPAPPLPAACHRTRLHTPPLEPSDSCSSTCASQSPPRVPHSPPVAKREHSNPLKSLPPHLPLSPRSPETYVSAARTTARFPLPVAADPSQAAGPSNQPE